jgi:glycosyltransferase involved in cell wall biosynthesis
MPDRAEQMAAITFVLPYYNEAGYVGRAVASFERQTDRRFSLVLVDNGSTDGGPAEAKAAADRLAGIDVRFLTEPVPGKLFALRTGCAAVDTPFVGTLDADTIYPPDYVEKILAAFDDNPGSAAVLAPHRPIGEPRRIPLSKWLQIRLWPARCHTGGFGQAFRSQAFRAAGGFDPGTWAFVLEDHEIVHRVAKLGGLIYRRDLVCHTSDRRADRAAVNWTLPERVLYKLLPAPAMDWFFYGFLRPRFDRRRMGTVRLREQHWKT